MLNYNRALRGKKTDDKTLAALLAYASGSKADSARRARNLAKKRYDKNYKELQNSQRDGNEKIEEQDEAREKLDEAKAELDECEKVCKGHGG